MTRSVCRSIFAGRDRCQQAWMRRFAHIGRNKSPALPAWVDLFTGAVAPYTAPPGMLAVSGLFGAPTTLFDMPADFPSVERRRTITRQR